MGEAWGEQEDKLGLPFVGLTGQELTRLLAEAGIHRHECFITNALAFRPPDNRIEALCAKKAEVGANYSYPAYKSGNYLRPEYTEEFFRLKEELFKVKPNLVLALGNVACMALLNSVKISSIRGYITHATLLSGQKVLPTYHPAALFRQWKWRPIFSADLIKAKREMDFPEVIRPQREVLVNPTLAEIEAFYSSAAKSAPYLSIDTETVCGQIEMAGFSFSPDFALVIPFVDFKRPDRSYWADPKDEVRAWKWVKALCALPCPKIFQNGLYDLQYFSNVGIRPKNCTADTMLLHHSIFPELQKGLGFLGSVYTNEAAWKLMRNRREEEEFKKDD